MADMKIGYEEMLAGRKDHPPLPTAVVYPCSEDALIGAVEAAKAGLIAPLLVGPKEQIGKVAGKAKVDVSPYEVVATADAEESASVAANLAGSGKARALMKGSLHTDQYMHAVLQRENRLRTSRLLSHCMLIAAPAYDRPIIVSDAAVNIAPDLDQKRDIVQNAIILARAIGLSTPKVAILAAVETVNSKMPATLDAAALAKMADRRQIVGGIVDGPLDLDIAVDKEAARIKGVETPVAGEADPHRPQHRSRQHDVQGARLHGRSASRRPGDGRSRAGDPDQPCRQPAVTIVLLRACRAFRRGEQQGSLASPAYPR
jgi:phosphate acetyltransferase